MILVTGGTGFLGSYIIKELVEKNYSVRALRRNSSKLPFYIPSKILEKVEWVEGDILDISSLEEAMEGVDAVIHAAGIVSFYKPDRNRIYQVNIQGTANMVNTMLEKNITRLVHISSIAAIGRSQTTNHVNEEKKWKHDKSNTPYAISKYKAEMEVWRGTGEGLNTVIVNPSTILGYGDWNATSCRIFRSVFNEFPWFTTGINGFVDVEDTAAAIVRLMESSIAGQRFIVNADNWTFQDLFNAIADGFQKKRPRLRATPLLGSIAWRMEKVKSIFSGKEPLLTRESARVANSHTFFSSDKLLEALPGFSFTPLQESIQKSCNKYLQTINQAQPLF